MKRLKQPKRLPSPSMLVALGALFVALGGTSYAAVSANSVDSRSIKNGTIRNEDFKDGTLRGQEFKRDSLGGGAIKEEALDASKLRTVRLASRATIADSAARAHTASRADLAAKADGLVLRTVVGADGARSNDRSVVSVAKAATGRYHVVFDRDVRACVATATLAITPPPADRRDDPVTGEVAVAPLAGNVNGVEVATAASDGRAADRAFHLTVSC